MGGERREAVAGERGHELGARERVLVEGAAGGGQRAPAPPDPGGAQPAHAVDVRHRDHQRAAGDQRPPGFGQDGVGPARIVLDHAERDVGVHGAVAQRQARQLHRGQRRRRRPPARRQRLDGPVHADGGPAALAQQQHVLAETAAALQHARAARQRGRDQVGQRRAARQRQQLRHRVAAPVLAPELAVGRHRVIGQHSA